MSEFNNLTVVQLREVADAFGVEVKPFTKKIDIIAAIIEEGVTYEDYQRFSNADRVEPDETDIFEVPDKPVKVAQPQNTVLVKMERANPFFQINGHTFTSTNPFLALTEQEAQDIFDAEEGFRIATPAELQSFYS